MADRNTSSFVISRAGERSYARFSGVVLWNSAVPGGEGGCKGNSDLSTSVVVVVSPLAPIAVSRGLFERSELYEAPRMLGCRFYDSQWTMSEC